MDFWKFNEKQTMVLWWQLTIRNRGCAVTSRFSDEVVLVMVESGTNSKNEQSVINNWSRCDIDTCGLSLRLITYSRTAPCKCRYSSFLWSCIWWMLWKNLICTQVNIINCRYVWFLIKIYLCKMRWDEILLVTMIRVINLEMVLYTKPLIW